MPWTPNVLPNVTTAHIHVHDRSVEMAVKCTKNGATGFLVGICTLTKS